VSQGESQTLGQISDVAATAAWANEITFSKWMAANLPLLGRVLDVDDLELIGTELAVGDFRCDIVAREIGSNRTLIVENQFTKTDHDHLGKLLTYAAQHTAQIIVWISTEIRDEHRAAIDWLNRTTSNEIGFFAVQLRVINIDGSRPAPLFDLRAFPNDWEKSKTPPAVSPRNEAYRQFFQPLINELRTKYHFTNANVALPQSWYYFGTGTTGFRYAASFAAGGLMRAELYIDIGSKVGNKAAFDYLHLQREYIDSKLQQIDWERLDNRNACRISIAMPNTSIDEAAARGSEMRAWLIEKLLALKEAFGLYLKGAAAAAQQASTLSEPNLEAVEIP
jgi:hypothetical protein